MKKQVVYVFVLLTIGFLVNYPSFSFSQNHDKSEIIKRVRQYEKAWNSGDAKATAAIYAEDGSHTFVNGLILTGRLEIEKGVEEMLAGPMKGTVIQLTPNVIRFPAIDIAVEDASFVMKGLKMPDGKEIPPLQGFCVSVYQKQKDEWMALKVQCMVPLIPPK